VTVTEESTMPDETELPSQDESPESTDSSVSETPELRTEEPFDITTDVVLPEYEPLDLPYSEWEEVRSQELLTANGFGNTPAEWRRAAGHADGLIRGTAFYLLARVPDPLDEALYRAGLEDSDQNVQSLVAYALYRLGDTSAESTLVRIAQLDANAHLAAPLAASLLAELGDPSAFATIEQAMASQLGYIRLTAVQYVPSFVPFQGQDYGSGLTIDIWALYCRALEDEDSQVQSVAEMQLQELKSPEALKVLEDCSTGP
jgi:hypothetical protein